MQFRSSALNAMRAEWTQAGRPASHAYLDATRAMYEAARAAAQAATAPRVSEVERRVLALVELVAFGSQSRRMVAVPIERWKEARSDESRASLVYHYGQNDVQPQAARSVSVGDRIYLAEVVAVVEPVGFRFEEVEP